MAQADLFSAEVALARFKLTPPGGRTYVNYGDVSRRLTQLRKQKEFDQLRELAIEAAACFGELGKGWLKLYAPDVLVTH